MDRVDPRAESAMARFLLDDETLVIAQRQHWAAVAQPVAMAVTGFFLALIAGFSAPARLGVLTDLAWKLWFVLLAYAAIRLLMWRFDWFVATDKRLLMMYGVIKRRVAMMPLAKVTDMSFNRTLLGQVLGYGQFVLESAGREQALRRIDFIRDAKGTYLAIVGEIFGEDDPAFEALDAQDDSGRDSGRDSRRDSRREDDTDPFLHLQLAGTRTGAQFEDDPTNLPVRPIGTFLPRPERQRRSGLRERVLRRAKEQPPPASFGHEGDIGWERDEPPARRKPRDLSDD